MGHLSVDDYTETRNQRKIPQKIQKDHAVLKDY